MNKEYVLGTNATDDESLSKGKVCKRARRKGSRGCRSRPELELN